MQTRCARLARSSVLGVRPSALIRYPVPRLDPRYPAFGAERWNFPSSLVQAEGRKPNTELGTRHLEPGTELPYGRIAELPYCRIALRPHLIPEPMRIGMPQANNG
jgi:hypothetical protein